MFLMAILWSNIQFEKSKESQEKVNGRKFLLEADGQNNLQRGASSH